MIHTKSSLQKSCKKELAYIQRKEEIFRKSAEKEPANWNRNLSDKIPDKVTASLQAAFAKTFTIVFERGTTVISSAYNKDNLEQNHKIQDDTIRVKGSRRELKRIRKMAAKHNLANSALATAEGAGLGILGIGMPDIVIFTGVLLRGAYECSAQYGYDSSLPHERYLILCMMEAALLRKDDWEQANRNVDRLMLSGVEPTDSEMKAQIKRTSDAFAVDMLLLKFVQGLPIVGIIGGLGNPVYYNKIMKYVQIKYYKRYLLSLQNKKEC